MRSILACSFFTAGLPGGFVLFLVMGENLSFNCPREGQGFRAGGGDGILPCRSKEGFEVISPELLVAIQEKGASLFAEFIHICVWSGIGSLQPNGGSRWAVWEATYSLQADIDALFECRLRLLSQLSLTLASSQPALQACRQSQRHVERRFRGGKLTGFYNLSLVFFLSVQAGGSARAAH